MATNNNNTGQRNSFGLPSFSSIRDGVVATVSAVVRPDTPPLSPSFPPLTSTINNSSSSSSSSSSSVVSKTTHTSSASTQQSRAKPNRKSTGTTNNNDDSSIPLSEKGESSPSVYLPLTSIANTLTNVSSSQSIASSVAVSTSASSTVAATLSREELSELAIRMNKRALTFERKVKAYRIGLISSMAILEDLSAVIEVITNHPLGYFIQLDNTNSNGTGLIKSSVLRNKTYTNDTSLLLKDSYNSSSGDSMDTIRHELQLLLQNHQLSSASHPSTHTSTSPSTSSSSGNGLTAAAVRAVVTVASDILPSSMMLGTTNYPDAPYIGCHVNMDNLHAQLCDAIISSTMTDTNKYGKEGYHSRTNSLSESGTISRRSSHVGTGSVPTPIPDSVSTPTVLGSNYNGSSAGMQDKLSLPPPALGVHQDPSNSSSHQQHVASLSALVASQNAQIRRLTNELVQAHKEAAHAVTEAQTQATVAIQDADNAQKYSEDAKHMINDLRSQVNNHQQRYESLQKQYEEIQHSNQQFEKEIHQLQHRYEETYQKLQHTEEHTAGIRAESDLRIQHLEEENERLRTMNEAMVTKLHAIETHNQSIHRSSTGKLENETVQLKTQLNELKVQKLQLEEQLKEARTEIQSFLKSNRTVPSSSDGTNPTVNHHNNGPSIAPLPPLSAFTVSSKEFQFVSASDVHTLQERVTDLTHRLTVANHESDDTTTALMLTRQQESILKNEIKLLNKQLESAMVLHNSVPLAYLKNIIIQFISFAGDPFAGSQRKALISVLATLLNFDEKERKKTGAPQETHPNNPTSPVAIHREKLLQQQRHHSPSSPSTDAALSPTPSADKKGTNHSEPSTRTYTAITPKAVNKMNELTEITNILTSPPAITTSSSSSSVPPLTSNHSFLPDKNKQTVSMVPGNPGNRTGVVSTPPPTDNFQRTSTTTASTKWSGII